MLNQFFSVNPIVKRCLAKPMYTYTAYRKLFLNRRMPRERAAQMYV